MSTKLSLELKIQSTIKKWLHDTQYASKSSIQSKHFIITECAKYLGNFSNVILHYTHSKLCRNNKCLLIITTIQFIPINYFIHYYCTDIKHVYRILWYAQLPYNKRTCMKLYDIHKFNWHWPLLVLQNEIENELTKDKRHV